jgi:membrane-bound lytic murein transglycosylase D
MAGCSGSLLVNDTDPTSDPSYIESATDNAATNENGAAYADTAPMAATDEESDVPATNQPAAASTRDDAFFQGGVEDPSLLAPQPQQEPVASEVPPPPQGQTLLDEALGFCDAAQNAWQQGELENALDDLDKAYALILRVEPNVNEELTQQKEDLRFLISKRILEIYASRNIVVTGQYKAIPLEMNRHIESEIKHFTRGEKRYFLAAYKRSGRYRPYIVQKLREAGLPEELSWLPLIESGFKVKALSRARALGLWQFIPSTGYKFGLKRTQYVDERIDPEKATDAAIAYLKELHGIFGDWSTVLAAYNCGEGRVLRVIRTQNVNYLDNFWDLYQRLPSETARYVPRFFATLHIIKNPQKYGFDDLTADPALAFDTLEINRQVHLKDIAKTVGVDPSDLEALNPELRYHLLPPEPYELRLPKGTTETISAALDSLPLGHLPQRAFVYHRVRSGQTLSTIARHYRTSIHSIMRANNMRRTMIRVGQRLKIPQRGYTTTAQASSNPPAPPASGKHYVRKGDSLWIIARRYGTTVQAIKSLNHLRSNYLVIGQILKIPGFKTEPLPEPETNNLSTYSVKNGDSPYTIAAKHNMALDRLLTINRLTPRSKIYPGQKLFIE